MERLKVVVFAPYARPCLERYRSALETAGCEVVEALAIRVCGGSRNC